MRKPPFIVLLKHILAPLDRTGGSSHDRPFQVSVDGPWQFQSGRFGPALVVVSTGDSDQPDPTILVQLRSGLEPPGRIEVRKHRRRPNQPDSGKRTPGLDDGILAGIGTEVFLGQFNLLFGGIITNPQHLELSL